MDLKGRKSSRTAPVRNQHRQAAREAANENGSNPENDEDCNNCRHPRSQHEIDHDVGENGGDSEHETRGPCEVHTCFCPRFHAQS